MAFFYPRFDQKIALQCLLWGVQQTYGNGSSTSAYGRDLPDANRHFLPPSDVTIRIPNPDWRFPQIAFTEETPGYLMKSFCILRTSAIASGAAHDDIGRWSPEQWQCETPIYLGPGLAWSALANASYLLHRVARNRIFIPDDAKSRPSCADCAVYYRVGRFENRSREIEIFEPIARWCHW